MNRYPLLAIFSRGPVQQLPGVEIHGDAANNHGTTTGQPRTIADPHLLIVFFLRHGVDGAVDLPEQVSWGFCRAPPAGIKKSLL